MQIRWLFWLIFSWILETKPVENWNIKIFFTEELFESIVCKMLAILLKNKSVFYFFLWLYSLAYGAWLASFAWSLWHGVLKGSWLTKLALCGSILIGIGTWKSWHTYRSVILSHFHMNSKLHHLSMNSLWLSDAICWHISGSILAQIMSCCLTATSHFLNQCWCIIKYVT